MPTRDSAPLGAPCWNDLASSDPERAKDFYSQVFGWAVEQGGEEFGGYVNFSKGDAPVAGMMRNDAGSGFPDGWTTYLATADAKATSDAAAGAGGTVLLEPMDVMDLGTMAILMDPAGGVVGIWALGRHRGFGAVGDAGTPAYHELHTSDFAAAVAFYERVFGWSTRVVSDTDDFRYTNLVGTDGEPLAGVLDASSSLPKGASSSWEVYFAVEDVDAALATVQRLGGAVLEPAKDTPYRRVARAADPTGAAFTVCSVVA